jgi:tagatose 1,6-diphosphate aldolase
VACGRATWQDGVAIYACEGLAALEAWLAGEGKRRIEAFNQALAATASPWWAAFD